MKIIAYMAVIAMFACFIPQLWPVAPMIYATLILALIVFLYSDSKAELEEGISLEQQKYDLAKKRRDMELEARKIMLENERFREMFDRIQASKERIDSAESFLRKMQDIAKNQAALDEFKQHMRASSSDQPETTLYDDEEAYDEDICDNCEDNSITEEENSKSSK